MPVGNERYRMLLQALSPAKAQSFPTRKTESACIGQEIPMPHWTRTKFIIIKLDVKSVERSRLLHTILNRANGSQSSPNAT